MSIGSIGSAGNWPTQQSASPQGNWHNVVNAASGTLGLSTPSLQQQLQSGSSLSSIAQTQGVSQQTLISSISSALTQNGSTATGTQLQQIATNIANRTPGGHHHHPGGPASLLDSSSTSGSSSTDGTSSSDPSSLFSNLLDASGSSSSGSDAANPAAQSNPWQGIDLSA
ncbi:MAG TPA: hypothetical protein VG325_02870 [Solirubrobacteraceae bacterium]|nr:hypothetical protein [Solirubrobacteraceae bacterium]